MSERLPVSPEANSKPNESLQSREELKQHTEKLAEAARKAETEHNNIDRNELKNIAEKHADDHQKNNERHQEETSNKTVVGLHQSIKDKAFKEELKKVQNHLSRPSRAFSKIIHNKTVEQFSEVGANTVARPSGVLGGSILTFFGSLVIFWMAKHNGFEYNFSVMLFLFIGGFCLGAILELAVWAFKRARHAK